MITGVKYLPAKIDRKSYKYIDYKYENDQFIYMYWRLKKVQLSTISDIYVNTCTYKRRSATAHNYNKLQRKNECTPRTESDQWIPKNIFRSVIRSNLGPLGRFTMSCLSSLRGSCSIWTGRAFKKELYNVVTAAPTHSVYFIVLLSLNLSKVCGLASCPCRSPVNYYLHLVSEIYQPQ